MHCTHTQNYANKFSLSRVNHVVTHCPIEIPQVFSYGHTRGKDTTIVPLRAPRRDRFDHGTREMKKEGVANPRAVSGSRCRNMSYHKVRPLHTPLSKSHLRALGQ